MGKVTAHPFGTDLVMDSLCFKVVNGIVFRWSDAAGWVRSSRTKQEIMREIEYRRNSGRDLLREQF